MMQLEKGRYALVPAVHHWEDGYSHDTLFAHDAVPVSELSEYERRWGRRLVDCNLTSCLWRTREAFRRTSDAPSVDAVILVVTHRANEVDWNSKTFREDAEADHANAAPIETALGPINYSGAYVLVRSSGLASATDGRWLVLDLASDAALEWDGTRLNVGDIALDLGVESGPIASAPPAMAIADLTEDAWLEDVDSEQRHQHTPDDRLDRARSLRQKDSALNEPVKGSLAEDIAIAAQVRQDGVDRATAAAVLTGRIFRALHSSTLLERHGAIGAVSAIAAEGVLTGMTAAEIRTMVKRDTGRSE